VQWLAFYTQVFTMLLTQKMSIGRPSHFMKHIYTTCVLCRDGGIIEYPLGMNIDHVIGNTKSSQTHVSPAICGTCASQGKNQSAIEYFDTHGIELSYIESTLVYREAVIFCHSNPVIILQDGLVRPLQMRTVMNELKDNCILYSMEYDCERLFPIPMDRSFFGL
jgi:hypothetical protein